MFETYLNQGDDFNTLSQDVAMILLLELGDGEEMQVAVPGGCLEVDYKVERWMKHGENLECFCTYWHDRKGLRLDDRESLTTEDAVGAFITVLSDPRPIVGYFSAQQLYDGNQLPLQ